MNRIWLMGLMLVAGMVGGCSKPETKIERSLAAAMAPETAAGVWSPAIKDAKLTPTDVRAAMGSNNLTSFLFTLTAEESDKLGKDHSWKYEMPSPDVLAQYMEKHSTLVARKHIKDLQWTKRADSTLSGSFAVKTPYGLKATLLFAASEKGGSIMVTKLAIAKKQSLELADGFSVFQKP